MKAKKVIAIGLVAAMTLGMSTSAFAQQTNYQGVDWSNVPQFEGWGEEYGPYQSVFQEEGQGWLEGGEVETSIVNVIVPTTPDVKLRYGDPAAFDFGFDPLRLASTQGGQDKYRGKADFSESAKFNGVYFANGPKTVEDTIVQGYDDKSVVLRGTNIGTDKVTFTVNAALEDGEGIEYLAEAPELADTAYSVFDGLYAEVGPTWESFVTEGRTPVHRTADIMVFAIDLLKGDNPGYNWTGQNGAFSAEQWAKVVAATNTTYKVGNQDQDLDYVLTAVIEQVGTEGKVEDFLKALKNYKRSSGDGMPTKVSDAVGLYMSLNTATGNTLSENTAYINAAKEAPFEVVNGEDAAVSATVGLEGTDANYELVYDGKKYVKEMVHFPDNEDPDYVPCKTVAFFFKGISTYSKNLAAGTNIVMPSLKFTWTFEQVAKEPVLKTVNGIAVEPTFAKNPVFDVNDYDPEIGLELGFNFAVKDVKYSTYPEDHWWSYSTPSDAFEASGNNLTVKDKVINQVNSNNEPRYWQVAFIDDEGKIQYLVVTFTGPNKNLYG
jgi:hypothetical protein